MTIEADGDRRREAVFDAIRRSGHCVERPAGEVRAEADALLFDVADARPPLLADDIVDAFRLRFDGERVVGATCETVADMNALPAAVSRYLERSGLSLRIALQPTPLLRELDWSGIETDADVERDESVAVLTAEYGIAETGSVVVHSGADMPVLLNFLPLHAIVAVPAPRILPFLDDYAAIAGTMARESGAPRNICLITGASGTTDIEGVLVKGAHGPKFLHIVVTGS